MPILTQDTIGLRQARSIRNRTEEISDELVELRAVAGKPNKAINFVQAGIWGCVSLANQWKSLTAIISVGMEQDQIDDYRGLAEILRPAAKEFVRFCEVVHAAATEIIHTYTGTRFEGLADLDLAHKDAVASRNWLDCWPSSTPEIRDAARKEIQEGKSRAWREVAAASQEAN